MSDFTFFYDPSCPWTWKTFRWLEHVVATKQSSGNRFDVALRSCSLLILNGESMPEKYRHNATMAHRALRLVEKLHQEQRSIESHAFYAALGRLHFDEKLKYSDEVLQRAAVDAGLGDCSEAFDATEFDDAIKSSTHEAMKAAGPNVGSPVLLIHDLERGLHGPIISEAPSATESVEMFDAICTLMRKPYFYEVKRGR